MYKGQFKQKNDESNKTGRYWQKSEKKTMLRRIEKSVYNIYIYREQSL